jgi:hypothetical protein
MHKSRRQEVAFGGKQRKRYTDAAQCACGWGCRCLMQVLEAYQQANDIAACSQQHWHCSYAAQTGQNVPNHSFKPSVHAPKHSCAIAW